MNIAEILKNCPKGMKLYSPIFGEVEFGFVSPDGWIKCYVSSIQLGMFYPDGTYSKNGEVMLFPSKEQRDWNKFQIPLKFGDIVAMYNCQYKHTHIAIFDKYVGDKFMKVVCTNLAESNEIKTFDENEHWNKQGVRYATEKEKEFFFNLLKEQGYYWTGKEIKKKFDICSLKPYDKVLVRTEEGTWYPSIISWVNKFGQVYLIDSESSVCYVIPFEGNEYLIGTQNDPDPYYITWE